MAIYQGDTKISGAGVAIDSALSDNSTNPVQNQAVTEALENVGYNTWQKPAEWIDIRSGALPNSVYFLVGHSADFSKYPKFLVNATISNSGTYDVFVDGVKLATTASGTDTTINWQTLALESGWDVTYPEQFRTHIVRVTPTTSSNTLSSIKIPITEAIEFGLLWVHFSISYAININAFVRQAFAGGYCYLLEAITTNGDELNVTGNMEASFFRTYSLKTIPTLVGNGPIVYCNRMFGYSSVPVVKLKNILLNGDQVFWICNNLKKIETQNSFVATRSYVFDGASNLTKLPPLSRPNNTGNISYFLRNCTKLKDTCLDFSGDNAITSLQIGGSSNSRIDGLKGLTVSNEAPFTGTSPQINVAYTGLDRVALINLFKSMPYNVGYTVVGSPTITDGVASGFSSSNYLTCSQRTPTTGEIVYRLKFTTGDSFPSTVSLARNAAYGGPVLSGNGDFGITIHHYNDQQQERNFTVYLSGVSNRLATNTTYIGECGLAGGKLFISLYDASGTLIVSENQDFAYNFIGNTQYIGRPTSTGAAFSGSIDLNETYIKVNGVPWFTGKAAMTKTCSVVGCTGTADLTQDDKNIALNKGWELTVA